MDKALDMSLDGIKKSKKSAGRGKGRGGAPRGRAARGAVSGGRAGMCEISEEVEKCPPWLMINLETLDEDDSDDNTLEDSGGLWDGHIQDDTCKIPILEKSFSWSGGQLQYRVWELINLTTNCKRVLLAFDRATCSWLRKLAQSVSGLTFIAITDLDHHHIDRLTFLAAPPREVLSHYGWDLSKECKLTGVYEDASIDIKWLGLGPSDIDAHAKCFKLHAFKQGETDFKAVLDRLLTIPTFAKNEAWKDELQRLLDRPLFMAFMLLQPSHRNPYGADYISDDADNADADQRLIYNESGLKKIGKGKRPGKGGTGFGRALVWNSRLPDKLFKRRIVVLELVGIVGADPMLLKNLVYDVPFVENIIKTPTFIGSVHALAFVVEF
uniref:Uncharacterized protein n=1 Tax=Chenopodium quinoa TaxID=63459 RepID=A0A803KV57_CHEQI